MLGYNARIFGRQTSTRICLDWAAPVTGGGKAMGGRDGWGVEISIKSLPPFHFSAFNLFPPLLPAL